MHPGPIIRGMEITAEVADGPQSAIAQQVHNGVPIRMALLERALQLQPPPKRKARPDDAIAEASPHSRRARHRSGYRPRCATRSCSCATAKLPRSKTPGQIKAPDAEVFDAKGLVVAPGLVDIHVHLREPGQGYKETIATGTAAAAAGGFTSVCAMPNTVPVNDSPEITRWMQAPERGASARVFPIAAATRGSLGEALTDYPALKDAGAIAVTDDGKPILDDDIMLKALRAAARRGSPVIQHAEDTRLTGGCSMNAGALAFRLGLRGMPVEAESGLVERDICSAATSEERPSARRALSTRKALDAVREARNAGPARHLRSHAASFRAD